MKQCPSINLTILNMKQRVALCLIYSSLFASFLGLNKLALDGKLNQRYPVVNAILPIGIVGLLGYCSFVCGLDFDVRALRFFADTKITTSSSAARDAIATEYLDSRLLINEDKTPLRMIKSDFKLRSSEQRIARMAAILPYITGFMIWAGFIASGRSAFSAPYLVAIEPNLIGIFYILVEIIAIPLFGTSLSIGLHNKATPNNLADITKAETPGKIEGEKLLNAGQALFSTSLILVTLGGMSALTALAVMGDGITRSLCASNLTCELTSVMAMIGFPFLLANTIFILEMKMHYLLQTKYHYPAAGIFHGAGVNPGHEDDTQDEEVVVVGIDHTPK